MFFFQWFDIVQADNRTVSKEIAPGTWVNNDSCFRTTVAHHTLGFSVKVLDLE